jgi:RNA polymerase sigma factor (sigma-70 family)
MDDWPLIESYARESSEPAFRSLVERHAGLVYASALRQVREPQLAEEVAQAVFILLARKAGSLRRGTVLSGWLFQTTRFVAARALRSEQRRQRREQEAYDMQQLTCSDGTWQGVAPLIDEAIEGLARTDRDAILLRYVEGRSLGEVSEALGITEEAAKKRVARAVEKLRQTLGRKGAALPVGTIVAALVTHASASPPMALISVFSLQAVATMAPSGAAMVLVAECLAAWRWLKLKWWAGVGALATAVVAFFLVIADRGERRNVAESPEPESLAVKSVLQPDTNPGGGAEFSRMENPSLPHLKLMVIGAEFGEGVSNASVFLAVWRNQTVENHWNLRTDAAGVCVVAYEPDAIRIDVGVLHRGWAARYVTWPSEGSSRIPGEYVLRLPRVTNSLGGVVRDPSGRPLENAQIWFAGHEFGDSSHRERRRERFGFLQAVPLTRTDPYGRWSLECVPQAHRGFQLEARHPDFADTTLLSSPAQDGLGEMESPKLKQLWAGQLISTMNAALTVIGTVVDERHFPIAGARIQEREQTHVFTADVSGQFQIPKLAEGPWTFTVTAEGFAPVRTNAQVGRGMQPVMVILQTGAVLRVRVFDEAGLAVRDAEVGMEQWGENRHDFAWRAKTDFDGRIEWASAPAGVELELFARKDGFCYTRDVKLMADGEEHSITLQHALQVFGRVVDAEAGWGVRDFHATPGYGTANRFSASELRWYGGSTVRGTNGMFRLTFEEKVLPWHLRLTADGYEEWISEPLTNQIQTVLDIAMKRTKATDSVAGLVLLPDGSPAVGTQVALLSFEHNVKLRNQTFEGSARWLLRTGERGEFSFPANRLAHSVAAVSAAGYVHGRIRDTGEAVTLRLEPWGRVEGTVDESAARLGLVTVPLYDPAAQNYQGRVSLLGSYSAKPGPNREFVFEQVPPGEFCVFVNSMNNIPYHHRTPIVVRPGETTRVVIRERVGTRVTGRFIPPAGRALDWKKDFVLSHLNAALSQSSAFINPGPKEERPMRELEFWTSSVGREHINTPRVYSAFVQSDGSFVSLEHLPPGNYRFTTTFKGASATRHITVGEDQPEELPLGDIPLR